MASPLSLLAILAFLVSSTCAYQIKNSAFEVHMPADLDEDRQFSFFITDRNFQSKYFLYTFYRLEGDRNEFNGSGTIFYGDENKEINVGFIPEGYTRNYFFSIETFDLFSGAPSGSMMTNDFYFNEKDTATRDVPRTIFRNAPFRFNLTNNFNETLFYNYNLRRDEDLAGLTGSLGAGDNRMVDVHTLEAGYNKGDVFELSIDTFTSDRRHNEQFVYQIEYDDRINDFYMSGKVNRDEEVTFEFTNYEDVTVRLSCSYSSNDGGFQDQVVFFAESGETIKPTIANVTMANLMYDYHQREDQPFNFDVSATRMDGSSEPHWSRTVDFIFIRGHQQSDFELEMSRVLRTDRDVGFSFTNNMDRPLYYMYWFASHDGEVMRPGAGEADPNQQVRTTLTDTSNTTDHSDFRFWFTVYDKQTDEQFYSGFKDDFVFSNSTYFVDYSMEIGPGRTFNFMVANFDEEATERQFDVVFVNEDESVLEEQSYLLAQGEEKSVDFYKFSNNWEGDENFKFGVQVRDETTDEVFFKQMYEDFNFTAEQDMFEFRMERMVYVGANISFAFANILKRSVLLDYNFYSSDGLVSFTGKTLFAPGESMEVPVGQIEMDYSGSTDFVFEMRGFSEDQQENMFEIVRDDFMFQNGSYMFSMSRMIEAGQKMEFRVLNQYNNDMFVTFSFRSDDDSDDDRDDDRDDDSDDEMSRIDFQGAGTVMAGSEETFIVGTIPRSYGGSRNFTLVVEGYNNDNNEKVFTKTMDDFYLETGSYVIFMPRTVRPGFDITFSIETTLNVDTLVLMWDFVSEDGSIEFMGDGEIQKGDTRTFIVGSLPLGYDGSEQFFFNITGFDGMSDGIEKIIYEQTDDFSFDRKAVSILIETDQRMYRQGDRMRFRAVCLSPDMVPMQGSVSYEFEGPDGSVYRHNSTTLRQGVVDGEMPLHDDCQEGEWMLRVQYKGQEEVMSWWVSSEKRPRFYVSVDAPQFYHDQMQGFTVKMNAKFPRGEPVRGKARLRAEIRTPYNAYRRQRRRPKVFRQNFDNFDASSEMFMSRRQLRELGWQSWTDLELELSLTVTCRMSGVSYEDVQVVRLRRTNIRLDVEHRSRSVKPGMNYTAYISVSEADGKPLRDEDRQRNDLIVDVEYRYPIKGLTSDFVFSSNWADKLVYTPPKTERYVMELPEDGRVNFNMPVMDDDFEYVSFRCYTNTTAKLYGLSKSSQWIVKPSKSPSGSHVQVSAMAPSNDDGEDRYRIGDDVRFSVRFTEPVGRFTWMVMSRGTIVERQLYDAKFSSDEFEFSVPANFQMAPKFCIFVSYVRDDGELVGDYATVWLYDNMFSEVDMSMNDVELGFEEEFVVSVRTPQRDSYVGVSVRHDMSGSYYDDDEERFFENEISSRRMIRDMEQFYGYESTMYQADSRFTSMASGAMSTDDAFNMADLMVMTNANLEKYQKEKKMRRRRRQANNNMNLVNMNMDNYGNNNNNNNRNRNNNRMNNNNRNNNRMNNNYNNRNNNRMNNNYNDRNNNRMNNNYNDRNNNRMNNNNNNNKMNNRMSEEDRMYMREMMREQRPSWMWVNRMNGDEDSVRFNMSTPRMMTSYNVRAFVVSPAGFAMSERQNFKVHERMFMNVDAPRSVEQNETMIARVTVYNYMKEDLPVNMVLDYSDHYQLVTFGDDPSMNGPVRWVTVPAGGSARVDFPLHMHTQGDVELNVQIRSNRGESKMSRNVFVKAHGFRQCYSYTEMVRLTDDDNDFTARLKTEYPENAVEGSKQTMFYLYADLMRPTFEFLDQMYSMEQGNSQQNMDMLQTAMSMYEYTDFISSQDGGFTHRWSNKYDDMMSRTLQNQANFRNNDGSYRFFDNSDNEDDEEERERGSTWLTASVYGTYGRLMRLASFGNDSTLMMDMLMAYRFMSSRQMEDGSMEERGAHVHPMMQGNETSHKVALTAHVLVNIVNANLNDGDYFDGIPADDDDQNRTSMEEDFRERGRRSLEYIFSQLDAVQTDQYALAYAAYAFASFNHTKGFDKAVEYINNFRFQNSDESMQWWRMTDDERSEYSDDMESPYERVNSRDVEMTSYMLMAHSRMGHWNVSAKMSAWLVSQRNRMGAFSNSYTTSVATQAMTENRMRWFDTEMRLFYNNNRFETPDFEVEYVHDQDSPANFNTTRFTMLDNFFMTKMMPMDGVINMKGSGRGEVYMQVSVCYNLLSTPYRRESFDCDQPRTYDMDMNNAEIEYCCRRRDDAASSSGGMFVFQMRAPNGFAVDASEQRSRNPNAMGMNFRDGFFNVYFNNMSSERQCARAKVHRTAQVAANSPSYMMAREYYNTNRQNIASYSIERFQDSKACNVCGISCAGCPEPRLSEWREAVACVSCGQSFSTWRRYCIDPSLNITLPADMCMEQEQEERRRCNTSSVFPICPDSHDGLWRVLPSYEDKQLRANDASQMCQLKPSFINSYIAPEFENAAVDGVPGTDIEFYKSYVECDMSESSFGDQGQFSLSMLINVQSFQDRGKGVIFAYGDEGKPAVFKLWHHSMYGSPIVFRVTLNNFIYTVGPVDGRNLLQKWTHIMVTWNRNDTSFYINGKSVGWSFHFPSSRPQKQAQNPKLFIGRDTKVRGEDTMSGWVSSLDFWSQTLNEEEAGQVYEFYRPAVEASRDDGDRARLPNHILRYMAPDSYKQCFNDHSSIRDLFRRETCLS